VKKVVSIVLNNFLNDARVLKENVSLQKAGYDVRVVALHEEGLPEREEIQGIPVHRIRLKTKEWPKNKAIQLLKYIEFLYRVIRDHKDGDIYHCNDLNALPVGVIIKKFFNKNAKIVYDSHEYQTQRAQITKLVSKISFYLEKLLLPSCDAVIVVSDSIAGAYTEDYDIDRPEVILNAPNYHTVQKTAYFKERYHLGSEDLVFLYQGRLTRKRGIEKLVEVFDFLPKNYHLVLMGHGTEIRSFLENISNKNVHVHEAVKPEEILDYTASANIGVHPIPSDGILNHDYCLPNKIFEYTMANIPMIVSALPEMKHYVEQNGLGIAIVFDQDADAVARQIIRFCETDLEQYSKRLHDTALQFNWEHEEKKLLGIYKCL
jgi:glycosyltransferase involved in cell wall biosynthesis